MLIIKDKLTELIYVNVPGDKKMNTKSPIDMDPGAVIGGRLEMATTKYIDGDDHEKEEIDKAKTTFERIRPADICHGGCSAGICSARPCIKRREHAGSCFCRLHLPP